MEPLEEKLGALFVKKGMTLSLAESCTGGALAARLVSVSDASTYFNGSIVAYSNAAKEAALGVLPETLRRFGAVSEETAKEMAQGVRVALRSDIGFGVTGIAGPKGGSTQKPVGTVSFAFVSRDRAITWTQLFKGERQEIIEASVQEALQKIIIYLI